MREDQKRQHIIEATATLLLKLGTKKTSMEDIAGFAGASKVTVYKYFSDKTGVLSSVCEWLVNNCILQLQKQTESEMNPAMRMAGFTQVFSDFISNGQQSLCMELSKSTSFAAVNYASFENTVREMIFVLIRDGKCAQMIDPTLEDDMIYHYIDMGFCYFQNNIAYRERMRTDKGYRAAFLQLLWRNIFVGKALSDIG